MARSHALVSALWSELEAALSAAILHELFQRVEAFACLVAHLLALMPAREIDPTGLAAVWSRLMAELVCEELFSTVA